MQPDNAQGTLFDRQVVDPPELILDAFETVLAHRDIVREYNAAKRTIAAYGKEIEIQDEEQVLVGRFVIKGRARNGGGFEVPAWESVSVDEIRAID